MTASAADDVTCVVVELHVIASDVGIDANLDNTFCRLRLRVVLDTFGEISACDVDMEEVDFTEALKFA